VNRLDWDNLDLDAIRTWIERGAPRDWPHPRIAAAPVNRLDGAPMRCTHRYGTSRTTLAIRAPQGAASTRQVAPVERLEYSALIVGACLARP